MSVGKQRLFGMALQFSITNLLGTVITALLGATIVNLVCYGICYILWTCWFYQVSSKEERIGIVLMVCLQVMLFCAGSTLLAIFA